MKRFLKSSIAFALALAMVVPSVSANAATFELASVYSNTDAAEVTTPSPYGHLNVVGKESTGIVEEASLSMASLDGASLPSKYDPRKQKLGYKLPAIRDQGNFGTCWAHAALGALEISAIKNSKVKDSINLSEVQLVSGAYYHPGKDPIGYLGKDNYSMSIFISKPEMGGTTELAVNTMINRAVGLEEKKSSTLKYTATNMNKYAFKKLSSKLAYGANAVNIQNYVELKDPTVTDIKKAIMKYGAVKVSYYANYPGCTNMKTGAIYNPVNRGTNHDVILVGWDDKYSKSNFTTKPSKNGAWIMRNSWGSNYGDKGYFYLSYYDKTACEFTFIEGVNASKDNYKRTYQCDSMPYNDYFTGNFPLANMFTAKAAEKLGAVSFECKAKKGEKYVVEIYTGCSTGKPKSGKKVATLKGTYSYTSDNMNMYVKLKSPVTLKKNQKFSIVVTTSGSSRVKIDTDDTINFGVAHLYKKPENSKKYSYALLSGKVEASPYDVCIKAYTQKK